MFGTGLLKGLGVTIKHFVETYVDDVQAIPSRYAGGQDLIRQMPDEKGIFTIQYPEEKRQLPERFRYIPMLIYDTPKQEDRCTACGICAKVCPPQCIWIVRDNDESGKPVPKPAEFYIDASVCMSCGFCSEFCPFDAIKMNHDYELAVYERYPNLVYNMEELTVPLEYYAALYPTQFTEEETRRAEEEAKKAARASRRGAKAKPEAKVEAKPEAKPEVKVEAKPEAKVEAKPEVKVEAPVAPEPTPAQATTTEPPPSPAAVGTLGKPLPPTARTSGTLEFDELERRRAESYERYQERKGADAKVLHRQGGQAAAPAPAQAAIPPQPEPASQAEPKPAAVAEPEVVAPQPAAQPQAPAATTPASSGTFGKPLPATARTSGTLSFDELERRRAESYQRYRERKGADAKILPHSE